MVYRCDFCSRSFAAPSALQTHLASSIHSPRPYCEMCIEWFATETLLEQHYATSPAHYSSTPPAETLLVQHYATSLDHRGPIATPSTFSCTQCSLHFATAVELDDHTQTSIFHRYTIGKFYCDDCVLWFSDQNALDKHLQNAEEHVSQFACVDCQREFTSKREFEAHVLMGVLCQYGVGDESVGLGDEPVEGDDENPAGTRGTWNSHPEVLSPPVPIGSSSSDKLKNISQSHLHGLNSLHDHSASGPSSGPKTYHCLGQTCLRIFASPSALLQHLDSGACPSGINRHIVNSATIALDHSSAITNRLLRAATGRNIHEVDPDEEEADIATRYRAQAPPGGSFLMGRPQLPWGIGSLNELPDLCCPLCPEFSSPFRTVTALHEHMTSPVHDARIYHCSSTSRGLASNSNVKHVSRNFSTLGALAQHLESRGCEMSISSGPRIFKETVREVQERLQKVELDNVDGGVRLQGLEW